MNRKRLVTAFMTGCMLFAGNSGCDAYDLLALTLEEKVSQVFFVTPEELTGVDGVTMAGDITRQAFEQFPVGGIIYFGEHMQTEEQFGTMTEEMSRIGLERLGIPVFLGTDEEGGRVARLGKTGFAGTKEIPSMLEIGLTGDPSKAFALGEEIGKMLKDYHLNLDFAPVADIFENPQNTVIADRSFGYDKDMVSSMVPELIKGLLHQGVLPVVKHFPGHGDTAEDSHDGFAYSRKTLEELRRFEWVPFRAGIEAGVPFVMVGHISLPEVLKEDIPSTLSETVVTDFLREELQFDGVIITDAMNMGAITEKYDSGEAAVQAFLAGVDMILMPEDFTEAYDALLSAVRKGIISEKRLDESVERILKVKENLVQHE